MGMSGGAGPLFVFDGENRASEPVGLDVAVLQTDNLALYAQTHQILDGSNFNKIADIDISGGRLQQDAGGTHIDNMRRTCGIVVFRNIFAVMGDRGYNRRHINVVSDALAVVNLRFPVERDFPFIGYHAVREDTEDFIDHFFSENKPPDRLSVEGDKLIRVHMQQTAAAVVGSNIGLRNGLSRLGAVENNPAVFQIFHFYHIVTSIHS